MNVYYLYLLNLIHSTTHISICTHEEHLDHSHLPQASEHDLRVSEHGAVRTLPAVLLRRLLAPANFNNRRRIVADGINGGRFAHRLVDDAQGEIDTFVAIDDHHVISDRRARQGHVLFCCFLLLRRRPLLRRGDSGGVLDEAVEDGPLANDRLVFARIEPCCGALQALVAVARQVTAAVGNQL